MQIFHDPTLDHQRKLNIYNEDGISVIKEISVDIVLNRNINMNSLKRSQNNVIHEGIIILL